MKHGPRGDVMIIGVSREALQRNVVVTLYNLLGFGAPSTKSTEDQLYDRNVYFIGAPDESAVRRIQGSTLALAYIDEAACLPRSFWNMILSRLSIEGAQLYATCNPEGPVHWLKKDFIDRADDLDLVSWHFTLEDNPSLGQKYITELKKEYTGMWYKRFILGIWAVAHGLVYDGFDQDNVTDKIYDAPSYYIAGIDYGTSNATAVVLCAIRKNKYPQIVIEDEYYYDSKKEGRSKTDGELGDDIYKFLSHKNVQTVYVDPSAASLKLELQRKDLPVMDANNDVINGIRVVSKFVAQKNVVIHKRCKNLIDQMQSYAWCEKAASKGEDKPVKEEDHIVDSLRYSLFSAFPMGEITTPNDYSISELRHMIYGRPEDQIIL